jgi:hypothetical protein
LDAWVGGDFFVSPEFYCGHREPSAVWVESR